jgi:hypothetical protein
MKDYIIELVNQKPKHYVKIIKNNDKLRLWVEQESLIKSENFVELIYSAVNKVSNVCKYNNKKKFDRFSTGFIGCGPASVCKCTNESIAKQVSLTKSNYTNSQIDQINQKRSNTMIKKYGVEYNSQRDDIKHIWNKPKISQDAFDKLNDYIWLNEEYNIKNRSLVDIAYELKIYYSTVAEYCKKFNFKIRQTSNYSLHEKEICDFLNECNIEHDKNNWDILETHEIDIVIPSKNVGIELNGLYWHSYHPKQIYKEDKFRHLSKSENADKKGYNLIHITDYEWIHKKSIIKNIIKSKLGLNSKIFARNCSIQEVTTKEEKEFLNLYHLQGYVPSKKCYGLFHNNSLIMLLSLGKTRYNTNYDYEILRVCSKDNITVVGGLSKLISNIKKELQNVKIVTYCDFSKSSGNGYIKAGFRLVGKTGPGYFWTDGNIVISRYKSQKSQLKKWLTNFDPLLSESDNMFSNNYKRYWDCGNLIFET